MRERGRRLRLAEGYESQAEKACAEQEQTAGLGHRGKGDLINIVQATAGEIDLKGFDPYRCWNSGGTRRRPEKELAEMVMKLLMLPPPEAEHWKTPPPFPSLPVTVTGLTLSILKLSSWNSPPPSEITTSSPVTSRRGSHSGQTSR